MLFFIIRASGTVNTVEQAAKALEPLAGKFSYIFFALGVVGTGFLAIPVLTGSLSYMLAESFGWQEGLDKKFHEARAFYIVIILSLIIGLLINISGNQSDEGPDLYRHPVRGYIAGNDCRDPAYRQQ